MFGLQNFIFNSIKNQLKKPNLVNKKEFKILLKSFYNKSMLQ